jgi:hypothetical protein
MRTYIHFDGDDVGGRIELLLLDGRLDEAAGLSDRIAEAMLALRRSLEGIAGLKIHLFAGDDLIVSLPPRSVARDRLNELRAMFQSESGISISAGAGSSVPEALENLRRAKLSGKDLLVGTP